MNQNFREIFFRLECLEFPNIIEETLKQIEAYLSFSNKYSHDIKDRRRRSENVPDILFIKNMLFCQKCDMRGFKINIINSIQELNLIEILYTYFSVLPATSKSKNKFLAKHKDKNKFFEKSLVFNDHNSIKQGVFDFIFSKKNRDDYHLKILSELISLAFSLKNGSILNYVAHWMQKGFCDPTKFNMLSKFVMDDMMISPQFVENMLLLPNHSPLFTSYLLSTIVSLYFKDFPDPERVESWQRTTVTFLPITVAWLEGSPVLALLALKVAHDKFQKAVQSFKRNREWNDEGIGSTPPGSKKFSTTGSQPPKNRDSRAGVGAADPESESDFLKNCEPYLRHHNPLPTLVSWVCRFGLGSPDTVIKSHVSRLHLALLKTFIEAPKLLPNVAFRERLLGCDPDTTASNSLKESSYSDALMASLSSIAQSRFFGSKSEGMDTADGHTNPPEVKYHAALKAENHQSAPPTNALEKYLLWVAVVYKLRCVPHYVTTTTSNSTDDTSVKIESTLDDSYSELPRFDGMEIDCKEEISLPKQKMEGEITEASDSKSEIISTTKSSESDDDHLTPPTRQKSWMKHFSESYLKHGLPHDDRLYRIIIALDETSNKVP